jgi:hypothetical protein
LCEQKSFCSYNRNEGVTVNKKYGKAKRIGESNQGDAVDGERGVGEPRANRAIDGNEPLSVLAGDASWEDWVEQFVTDGYPDFAKVLERLVLIEERYLEYVDAHQARLKTRLQESVSSRNKFVQEIGDLRSDIVAIVQKQQEIPD